MSNAAQLEIELLGTKDRVRTLEAVVKQQSEALRESTKLLLKSRPPRPSIPHDRKRHTFAMPFLSALGEC